MTDDPFGLEDYLPGWLEDFDVDGMVKRLLTNSRSLPAGFSDQFRAQFQGRFDLTSDDGAASWKGVEDWLQFTMQRASSWLEELFDANMYWMSASGHPGARIDFFCRWGLIERGAAGVIYFVPDSEEGWGGLEVQASWSAEDDRDAILEEFYLSEARHLIASPEWGQSIACHLPQPSFIRATEQVLGAAPGDWVKGLLDILASKSWVTSADLVQRGDATFATSEEAQAFIDLLSPERASDLSPAQLAWVQDAYRIALEKSS